MSVSPPSSRSFRTRPNPGMPLRPSGARGAFSQGFFSWVGLAFSSWFLRACLPSRSAKRT